MPAPRNEHRCVDPIVRALALIFCLPVMISGVGMARGAGGEGRNSTLLAARNTRAVQREAEDKTTGRYDWGPCVIRDADLYRMWWVRLGGGNKKRFGYATTLPDGQPVEFTYPDWGDRIYYAESRDGRRWQLSGEDFAGPAEQFSPDADGPLMVLAPAETDQERNHVGCPSVINVAGTYYMYYEAPCEYKVARGLDGKVTVGGEYQGQVFVATSNDGKQWRRYPEDDRPEPIIRAPQDNKKRDRQRYGLGQPSVFYRKGKFVMHYVDSCTGPGDFIVRIEADNPYFDRARKFRRSLRALLRTRDVPAGAVARFAQTDVKYLDATLYLLRPAYGTGNLGILATRTGRFDADAGARSPADVFPQIRILDPRGEKYRERLFPRFLTNPQGEVLVEDGCVVFYYSSGLGFKEHAHTWDVHRSELLLRDLGGIERSSRP